MLLEEEDDELSEQDGVVESYCFYAKTAGALGAPSFAYYFDDHHHAD